MSRGPDSRYSLADPGLNRDDSSQIVTSVFTSPKATIHAAFGLPYARCEKITLLCYIIQKKVKCRKEEVR